MTFRALTVSTSLAMLLFGAVPVHAGPCSADIARIEGALRGPASSVLRPSTRQSVGAQLSRQPTQQSVMTAQEQAQAGLDATLARARALDAREQGPECAQAVRDAKLILGLP